MSTNYRIYQICKIEFKDNAHFLLDCNNSIIRSTNAMNRRYRIVRRQTILEEDMALVWILTGIHKDSKEKKIIQVGQCKNLTQMLSGDIRKDIKKIINAGNSDNKYSKLHKEFTELSFYEVELDDFDIGAIGVKLIFPEDTLFKKIERAIKAAYVEAMIAFVNDCLFTESGCGIWNPSTIGLDGYFYSYFEVNKYAK